MKKAPWHVILSAAKNLSAILVRKGLREILRCAQNDTSESVFNGMPKENSSE